MQHTEEKQTFLLPENISEQTSVIHASCYRLSLSLLRRSEQDIVSVPIENLNLIGLVTDSAIFFADASDRTAEQGEISGKIRISWHLHIAEQRDVNEQHIPMKVVFYDHNLENLQQKLTGEYFRALMLMDECYRDKPIPPCSIQISNP